MSAHLSEPVTDKISTDEVGKRIICGASSMQGWRNTQEDAHNCITEYDENTSFFAVYDGHGGHAVATYSAQHLPQYLKNCEAYRKGDYVQALKDAFLGFDATLTKPDVLSILTKLASNKGGKQNSELDEEEEDIKKLYEEAEMPLDQVMAKYQNYLNPNEKKVGDRSSSSGLDSSSSSDGEDEKVEVNKERESVVSSQGHCSNSRQLLGNTEADQASSNGDSEPVKTASDEIEAEKSKTTMPDSSGDAKIQTVSDKQELNGETGEEVKTVKESEGVIRSSASHENGEVVEGEGKGKSVNEISSSVEVRKHAKLRPRTGTPLYHSQGGLDLSDSDSDDEGDESFQMPDNSNDDSDEDEDSDSDDDGDEDKGDTEEEDNENEDEAEDKEEDNILDDGSENMTEKKICSMREATSHYGSTAVVALLKGQELYVANAGDSRCIVCRKGQAIEMSLDHKPEDEAERKRIQNAGGRVSKDGRVNDDLNLSRALGDHAYKQSEGLPAEEQMITALPDVRTLTIDPAEDEFMVLACDGISYNMSSQEIVDFVQSRIQQGKKLSRVCEEMFDYCLRPEDYGRKKYTFESEDNMTAVIIQFRPELANQNESKSLKHSCSPSSDTAKRSKTEETEI